MQGSQENKDALKLLLKEYELAENSESPLEQLGQMYLFVGINSLYNYVGTEDIQLIGSFEKERWDELAEEQKSEIAPHLANKMIAFAKKENLAQVISQKWSSPKREINNNIMNMARYITEGILDAIE